MKLILLSWSLQNSSLQNLEAHMAKTQWALGLYMNFYDFVPVVTWCWSEFKQTYMEQRTFTKEK